LATKALDVAVDSGELPQIALRNRAIVRLTAAEKASDIPYDALKDIDSLVLSEDCDAESYLCAAEIYAYANSLDESYENRAHEFLKTAIQLGIPANIAEQSVDLSKLCDDTTLGEHLQASTSDETLLTRNFFVNPLH
jgi:hypothetical protein